MIAKVLLLAALAAVSLALPYQAPIAKEEKHENDKGIERVVEYVADEHGYKAQIKTNEPGTDSQNPADVIFDAKPIVIEEPKAAAAPKPQYEAVQSSSTHEHKYEARRYEIPAPRYEAPKYEIPEPKYEARRYEAPKYEVPEPKYQAPKYEIPEPKYEVPRYGARHQSRHY
ncbi:Cuticle protein 10.9 like protein [Argiope bruennichi]|uniref:Cuticle protein 10.9 like protein n=1 Tax=Argiope bruennichi TaxID=94029 RepID=A0A8T0EZ28_ARGBR|nr:Cuticle protein 10.9 like protein [Argiope bruennichi]